MLSYEKAHALTGRDAKFTERTGGKLIATVNCVTSDWIWLVDVRPIPGESRVLRDPLDGPLGAFRSMEAV